MVISYILYFIRIGIVRSQHPITIVLISVERKVTDKLPAELQRKIASIDESLSRVMFDLQSGKVTVAGLQKLSEVRNNFFENLKLIQVAFM